MAVTALTGSEISARVLDHLLCRVASTRATDEPFSHVYWENFFPEDVYEEMVKSLPEAELYSGTSERHHANGDGGYVRGMFPLAPVKLALLWFEQQELWRGIAAALTAPELKKAVFRCLAKDLSFRYGIPIGKAEQVPAHARPTLY